MEMCCQVPGSEKKGVNVGSVASRLLKMKANLSKNGVIVNVKRPKNICGEISVDPSRAPSIKSSISRYIHIIMAVAPIISYTSFLKSSTISSIKT